MRPLADPRGPGHESGRAYAMGMSAGPRASMKQRPLEAVLKLQMLSHVLSGRVPRRYLSRIVPQFGCIAARSSELVRPSLRMPQLGRDKSNDV